MAPRYPEPFEIPVGPFVGVNDALDLGEQDMTRAASIVNGYIPSQPGGGPVVSRPGFGRAPVVRTLSEGIFRGAKTLTGTVTVLSGSANVTGVGSLFTSELIVGAYLSLPTAGLVKITAIASDTSLTIQSAATADQTITTAYGYSNSGSLCTTTADIVQVGDTVTIGAETHLIATRIDATHFTTAAWSTGGKTTTTTVYGGGGSGPLYDPFLYINTSGTIQRLVFSKATSTEIAGSAATKYRFLDGSSVRYRLLEYNPSATYLTFTDRTSASMDGVAIDTSNRLYSINFANYWILSDGTNPVRKVTSAFVLSNLTGYTIAAYGRPTVYYGKLFFIDNTDKATLQWSEESDPDLGYGTAGYNNTWTLRQTSPDTIEAIEGTNAALYVWRTNSTTAITGAVNSDFRSSGTQDGISTTIGTRSPDAVVPVGDTVFFLDQYCRPHVIEPGRGIVPLYDNVQTTLGTPPTSAGQLRKAWGRLVSSVKGNPIVVFCFPSTEDATTQTTLIAFDAYTREFLGTWTHPSTPDVTYGAIWRDTNNTPVLAMSSNTANDVAIYTQRSESNASVHLDDLSGGSQLRVALLVETPKMVGDIKTDKLFTRVDMGGRDMNGVEATLSIQTRTSRSSAYGSAMSFTSASVSTDYPDKYAVGLNGNGRWWQCRVTNDTSTGGRTAIGEFVVEGVARRTDPHIK